MTDQKQLATLLHRRFYQRKDVFAEYGPTYGQPQGCWHPVERKLKGTDLIEHLDGERVLGTYLVDPDGLVKFFTLDLDFREEGQSLRVDFATMERKLTTDPDTPDDELAELWPDEPEPCNPREVWLDLQSPLRPWLAFQVRCLAAGLAHRLRRTTDLTVAVTYSGGKGMHVHAWLPQPRAAREARYMANKMMASWMNYKTGEPLFVPVNDFTWHTDEHYANFNIEVFPKQDEIASGGFGNLVRIPLGVHPKTGQRSHFVDLNSIPTWHPLAELDPLVGLTRGSVA